MNTWLPLPAEVSHLAEVKVQARMAAWMAEFGPGRFEYLIRSSIRRGVQDKTEAGGVIGRHVHVDIINVAKVKAPDSEVFGAVV